MVNKKKKTRNYPKKIDACGGKKKGGCGSNWGGATKLQTSVKVSA